MEKFQKALGKIIVILLSCFNIYIIVEFFMLYSLKAAFILSIILSLPLIFLLVCSEEPNIKISVNYVFIAFGLLSFLALLIYKICFLLVIIPHSNNLLACILLVSFILFIILAFLKNLKDAHWIYNLILAFVFIYIIPHILVLFIPIACTFGDITNPNRYNFVKLHYFSPEETRSLPEEIPSDATNINFYYTHTLRDGGSRKLYLEFDSNTITENDHHAIYNIYVDNDIL